MQHNGSINTPDGALESQIYT